MHWIINEQPDFQHRGTVQVRNSETGEVGLAYLRPGPIRKVIGPIVSDERDLRGTGRLVHAEIIDRKPTFHWEPMTPRRRARQ